VAGRDASGKVLNAIAKNVPWLIGGSADLAPSTKTRLTYEGAGDFMPATYGGKNFHFGVRELTMGACLNGMAVSKLRPYGSGFFVFSDFCKPTIRLSAIMEVPATYIFTHDSIGVGEDGPTHQPIEHLISMRAIPGLIVLRPGDGNEVAEAWKVIMNIKHEPVVLVLSRQNMPTLDRKKYASAEGVKKGAYVLADPPKGGRPDIIVMATGTEVGLAVETYEKLTAEGVNARVVSMPSWELFEHQDAQYRNSVLPFDVKARISIEMASTFGWDRYVGPEGHIIGMKTFGASAPLKELAKKFGFGTENIIAVAHELLRDKHL
jgi:transketolase